MGARLGTSNPVKKCIALREDVYDGMCMGDKEHQFTGAHELGHMIMHGELEFARQERGVQSLKDNIEAEADDFAKELLGFPSPAYQRALIQVGELCAKFMLPKSAS